MELLKVTVLLFLFLAMVVIVIEQIVATREFHAAHREYRRLLLENANSLRSLREQIMLDGVATFDELEQLVRALERVAEGLPERHRNEVVSPLRSDSLRQRARYAARLMNKAGIGSGYIPIPAV